MKRVESKRHLRMKKILIASAALGFAAAQALAVPADITVQDYNAAPNSNWVPSLGVNNGKEDNESEAPAASGQLWDLEAISLDTGKAFIVSGYDLSSVNNSGPATYDGGDLFIKVGLPFPTFLPTAPSTTVPNSTYGYTYAVDLSDGLVDTDAAPGIQVDVFALSGTDILETADNDFLNANPWRLQEGQGTLIAKATITYTKNLTAAAAAGITGVASHSTLLGYLGDNFHDVLELDISSWLVAGPADIIHWHYTMECGNDMLKGRSIGGFRAPDGGMTLSMLGLGIGALALAARRRQ